MQAIPYNAPAPEDSRIIRAAAALGVMGAGDAVPARMLTLLCDPQVDPHQVSELIRRQPALCARVLRVANSPFYGQRRGVRTLDRAFLVLGIDAVRGIAAAACLERTTQVCQARGILDMDVLLDHCLATAVVGELLARSLQVPAAPEAFIAGLMHDFGILIQLGMNPDGMATMMSAWRAQPDAVPDELELRHLGVRHDHCAAVAFESWNLPPSLVALALHHHRPATAPERFRPLVAVIQVAGVLAVQAGFSGVFEPTDSVPEPEALQLLGLQSDDERLVIAREDLAERVQAFRA